MNRSNNSSTLTGQVKNTFSKTKNIGEKVANSTLKLKNTISTGISDKINKITNVTSRSQWFQGTSTFINNFIETNTAFSKFVFIVLVLIIFIFLFQVGMALMTRFISGYSGEVYVMKGMCISNKTKTVSSNPNITDSVPIIKSVNQDDGIEFSWSVWFYVKDLDMTDKIYKRIFSKGKEVSDNTNLKLSLKETNLPYSKILNNSPGMYITSYIPDPNNSTSIAPGINFINKPNTISLVVCLNTYKPTNVDTEFSEFITISDIPKDKWVNSTLIVKNRTVNVYINGKLNKSKDLNNIPSQNNYDTYIGDDEGFTGFISNLRYINRAISYEEVRSINASGPNLTSVDTVTPNGQDYLSMSWYYNTDK